MSISCKNLNYKIIFSGGDTSFSFSTLFIAVVLGFYVLVGPLRAILSTGEAANFVGTSGTIYRGLDHRPFLIWGWVGAFISYASILVGFYIYKPTLRFLRKRIVKASLSTIRLYGLCLCWLGLIMYALVNGDRLIYLLNPFRPDEFSATIFGFSGLISGPFQNYFQLAINFLIPGILIQFTVWLRDRKQLLSLILWSCLAVSIYLSEAFRYRILLLFIPMILLWLFYAKKRPKIVALVIFMLAFVGVNGIIGLSRTNIRGLDLSRTASYSPLEVFVSSFEEAGVFFTTSAVINAVPSKAPYAYFAPIVATISQPIPRALYPQKPKAEYSSSIREFIYSSPTSFTAYLNYAEYYLVWGWATVVLFSLLLGILIRRLWSWFLQHQHEPLPQAIYLLNATFLYVVVSRGYLAQVVVLYGFTVLPAYIIFLMLSRK